MSRLSGVLVAATFGMFALSASAASVSLTDIDGVWSAAKLSDGSAPAGVGTSSMAWGVPASGKTKSGYRFAAGEPASDLVKDTPFSFGLFSHENFPIYGNSLVSAELSLTFSLLVDGVAKSLDATYKFKHIETPNVGGGNCCNDFVEFLTGDVVFDEIDIGGVKYTFKLDGFVGADGKLVNLFSTEENKSNSARLIGRFTTVDPSIDPPEPSPVPLPLPAALLGFGLTGLGVVGRLRRKS